MMLPTLVVSGDSGDRLIASGCTFTVVMKTLHAATVSHAAALQQLAQRANRQPIAACCLQPRALMRMHTTILLVGSFLSNRRATLPKA